MRSQTSRITDRFISLAAALSLALASAAAIAQSGPYPNRPIRVIVPYSAGTGSDVLARTLGKEIAERAKSIGGDRESRRRRQPRRHSGGGESAARTATRC